MSKTNGQHYGVTLSAFRKLGACDIYTKDDYKYAKEPFDGRYLMNFDDILNLSIPAKNKIWIINKIVPRMEMAKFQILWAYNVLHLFETRYPHDNRPRSAIEALELFVENPTHIKSRELNIKKMTANKAAIHTSNLAAKSAALAASWHSAYNTAWSAASAIAWTAKNNTLIHTAWTVAHDAECENMLRDLKSFAEAEYIG